MKRRSDDESPLGRLARTFADPPAEYGAIDGWWWEAGRLDEDRLRWQLEEFRDKGIAGTWFYSRYLYDEPLASDPRYFSDGWWEFTRFAAEEQQRLGLRNFFSNWTALEFEQDAIRKQREAEPDLWGRELIIHRARSAGHGPLALEIPSGDEALDAAAYEMDGESLDYSTRVDLADAVRDGSLEWTAPRAGWLLTAVVARPWDLDYLNPKIGERWTDVILAEYERRLPGMMGSAVEAFGPDEMTLLSGAAVFSPTLLQRLKARLGSDVSHHLIALFHDVGPQTERIRANYYDEMCALLEENFYQAPTRWLHERGMQHATISQLGDDPLTWTYHYGDFQRYIRSFDIPGNEDPGNAKPGSRNLFHSKVSSSTARLYGPGRAVVLGHYSSGWGHTLEENLAWTYESYAKGMNLYSRHLGSYSLMGGWYEYFPPHDHFHHPYWRYWKHFADHVRRLSFIVSQGKHRPDVALLYPISAIHAHWIAGVGERKPDSELHEALEAAAAKLPDGNASLEALAEASDLELADQLEAIFEKGAHEAATGTTALAEAIYRDGIDFDFIDNSSLARATVRGNVLEVSGVEFRCLLLPPMTTIPIGILELAERFYEGGGTVGAFGRLPHASVENGRGDPRLRALVEKVFGLEPGAEVAATATRTNERGGCAFFVPGDAADVPRAISDAIVRDVVTSENGVFHAHQHVDGLDVYLLFNTEERERDLRVRLRVDAEVDAWDPSSGERRPLHRVRRESGTTEVALRMGVYEGVVLVCSPGISRPAVLEDDLSEVVDVLVEDGETLRVHGFDERGGTKRARVVHDGEEYVGEAEVEAPPAPVAIDGPFAFRLEPTMDNRWGDFRHPPSEAKIGAEARRFCYREEGDVAGTEHGWHRADLDDSEWPEVTYSYGPYWRHLGPFTEDDEPGGLLERALQGDEGLDWRRYSFSKRFGSERRQAVGWPGLEHLLGVSENFLVLDDVPEGSSNGAVHDYLFTVIDVQSDTESSFVFGRQPEHEMVSVSAAHREPFDYQVPAATRLWVNGEEVKLSTGNAAPEVQASVRLKAGRNAALLKVVRPDGAPAMNYAAFVRSIPDPADPYVPALRWFSSNDELVYDPAPDRSPRVGWYRFWAPPGAHTMRLHPDAESIEAWIDGQSVPVEGNVIAVVSPKATASQVAMRVEQRPGTYAGAAFPEPVEFECAEGQIDLGDWSEQGLATYSGVGVYGADVELTATQLQNRVTLDLGYVKTVAEVFVNGQPAGVRLARPFRCDITALVHEGENRIEVKVANTLANHMSTYPTKWVFEGQTVSGLLGPVQLRFSAPVQLLAAKVPEAAVR